MKMISKKYLIIFFFSILTLLFSLYYFFDKKQRLNSSFSITTKIDKFSLITHYGAKVNKSFLLNTPSIFFFGFTNCPDICPATLMRISSIIDELDDRKKISFYFVTVDPERDTKKNMTEYLKNFNNKIIGITGSVNGINNFLKSMHVYNEKIILDDEYYTYDHSSQIFLFKKNGNFFGTISSGEKLEIAIKKISMLN